MPSGKKGFQKGHQINKGVEKLTRDDKDARKMNAVEFGRIANKYLYLPKTEIEKLEIDPQLPMIDLIVLRVLKMAGAKADQNRIEWVLQRTMGKVPDRIIDETKDHEIDALAEKLLELAKKPV